MRRELSAVYDELKRRLKAGESSVYLQEETLQFLRQAAASSPKEFHVPPDPGKEESVAQPRATRKKVKTAEVTIPDPPVVHPADGSKSERLGSLREQVLKDPWCLSQIKPGKKIVFGVGDPDARILFCGEAPGADEEVQGEPFVGPAGQLLTQIIKTMGLERTDVYIANIMNYRPPKPGSIGNRPPTEAEMRYCLPFLLGQLEIVQPEVIVALGKTAMDGLMGRDPNRRMTRIRGQWMEFRGIPLLPTFHPSYLLRNQSKSTKRLVWEDMLAIMDKLEMPVSEKQRNFFL